MRHPHLAGIWIAFAAFTFSVDFAWATTLLPGQLGFIWPASLVNATPFVCAVVCLIAFVTSPPGNRSRRRLTRRLGRVSLLARYVIFAAITVAGVLGGALSLKLLVLCRTQSFGVPGPVSDESLRRIREAVGDGVTFTRNGSERHILFLNEKRGNVERTLSREHISAA